MASNPNHRHVTGRRSISGNDPSGDTPKCLSRKAAQLPATDRASKPGFEPRYRRRTAVRWSISVSRENASGIRSDIELQSKEGSQRPVDPIRESGRVDLHQLGV
jgi:hypothetical protein